MVKRNKNGVRPIGIEHFNTNAFQTFAAKFSSVRKKF